MPTSVPPAPAPEPATAFVPDDIVRSRANPSQSGTVTAVRTGDKQTRYQVFQDGKIASLAGSELKLESF